MHLTAPEFLGRVRAALAQQEDFDVVVEEFGVGCPCKTPALKSKGKQHLGTTAHKKAFEEPNGPFFGKTVREALTARAAAQGVLDVIIVAGSAPIQGNANDGVNADGFEPFNEIEEFERFEGEAESEEAILEEEADDDLSHIVAEE